ncbi:unnamed protein product [Paramecium octaurelia]|uniref:SAC domain-containing protein n=1 Tax=Paramecium octaurelia TaxID=43137 RepID=A0A8S1WIE4_PAROT|nr:unnamed protein product [Paramecium octaurelia]
MKEVSDKSKIVDGKRKRVMSVNGVMSVVTKELLREQKTPVPKVQKTVVKKQENNKKVSEKQQYQNDKRVKITKSALRELIQSHFIVVSDNEEALIQSSKYFNNSLVGNKQKPSSSLDSQSDSSSSSRKRLLMLKYIYINIQIIMNQALMSLTLTPNKMIIDPDFQLTRISNKLIIDRGNMKMWESKEKFDQSFQPRKIFGILGIFEVSGKPVLLFIEDADMIGILEGWPIYQITKVGFVDKKHQEPEHDIFEKDQLEKVKNLFINSFYFSYGIDLTNQSNYQHNRFWWNSNLCKMFPPEWQLKIIQGYVGIFQISLRNLNQIQYCLVSRRSFYKGGSIRNDTGIDTEGNVANYTETEQLIYLNNEKARQILCRGSIPLFWQYNIFNNQIVMSQEDPKKALNKHFQILLSNFIKIHFINLVDDGSQLSNQLDRYLTESEQMSIYKFNFKSAFLNKDLDSINKFLEKLNEWVDYSSTLGHRQQNIMRINCYDCLDQTNIVMAKVAMMGVQKILQAFKVDISEEFDAQNLYVELDIPSIHNIHPFLLYFKSRWMENGDQLRLIYKVGQQNSDLNQFYKNMVEEKQLKEVIHRVLGFPISESQANENIMMLERTMKKRENEYTQLLQKSVYVVTWNINAHSPNDKSLYSQLFQFQTPPHIVAIGFQELVKLNTLTVVGRQNRDVIENWKQILYNCLNTKAKYVLAAQQVMVGTFILVFVLDDEKLHISNVKTEIVKYGFGQSLGNKGGVIIKLRFYDSNICFVNVHLPAGQKSNDDRMAAFDYIHNRAELNQCDWVITFGDMNFRINLSQQQVVASISNYQSIQNQEQKETILKHLKEYDQLHLEKLKSQFLKQFHEADIQFLPTYKFDIGTEIYDTVKKRVPSFTDRILLKKIQKVAIHSVEWYDRIQGNFQVSDHRPVGCLIQTQVCEIDKKKKENLFRELIQLEEDEQIGHQYFPKIQNIKNFEPCTKFKQRATQLNVTLKPDRELLMKLCNPEFE